MTDFLPKPSDRRGAEGKWSDDRVEAVIGNLLRLGVAVSAAVVLVGGILYLARYGGQPADVRVFRGEPAELRSVPGIVGEALRLGRRGLIQLGLVLLIATPVARVVFSMFAFWRQGDRTYVAITGVVLATLLYSLFSGH